MPVAPAMLLRRAPKIALLLMVGVAARITGMVAQQMSVVPRHQASARTGASSGVSSNHHGPGSLSAALHAAILPELQVRSQVCVTRVAHRSMGAVQTQGVLLASTSLHMHIRLLAG